MSYTLYKNAIQLDTLAVVRYLHSIGCDATPQTIIERNYPEWVTQLPSIQLSDGTKYVGLTACLAFWEAQSGQDRLFEKAQQFQRSHPQYRIEE